jgi:hypothetical protein
MTTTVIVAAHQPHFLPWLGYLAKICAADLFVVMDDLQYEAQNFQNRNRIKTDTGAAWLTVPVERGSLYDRIIDKRIAHTPNPRHDWRRRAWASIETHYRRAPYFARYAPELRAIFDGDHTSLVELDLRMLDLARGWFAITTPIVRSSTLALSGARTDRIVSMVRAVGATTYLSGTGGSTQYLEARAFQAAGIGLAWHRYDHPVHEQRYPAVPFIPRLAFLDAWFNAGPACAAWIVPANRLQEVA